jgi:hypothetical protein
MRMLSVVGRERHSRTSAPGSTGKAAGTATRWRLCYHYQRRRKAAGRHRQLRDIHRDTAAPSSRPLSPHTRPVRLSKPRIRVKLNDAYVGDIWDERWKIQMTGALILGATALTLSAGVASAQVAYVSPGWDTGIEDYNNPNETMAQRVGLAPTLRRLVTPPLYD